MMADQLFQITTLNKHVQINFFIYYQVSVTKNSTFSNIIK